MCALVTGVQTCALPIWADLLGANGGIFKPQGEALSRSAKRDVKVLVVGNPANTNALIAMSNAADLDPSRFTAMMRLDHNRAIAQLAAKAGVHGNDVTKMTIWGNHSATQYPDVLHAEVGGKPAFAAAGSDQAWLEGEFIPTIQQRGAAIIKARGLSSRSEEHTSELQSLMRISYAVFCLKKKTHKKHTRYRIYKQASTSNNSIHKHY